MVCLLLLQCLWGYSLVVHLELEALGAEVQELPLRAVVCVQPLLQVTEEDTGRRRTRQQHGAGRRGGNPGGRHFEVTQTLPSLVPEEEEEEGGRRRRSRGGRKGKQEV